MRVTVTSDQISNAFDSVKECHTFDESRALYKAGRAPAEMIQAMCLRPEILKAFGATGDCVYPGGLLERKLKELVIIESSRANKCQFCTESHVTLVKMLGLDDNPCATLDSLGGLTDRERLAIEYTRQAMHDSNRIKESFFDQLRAHFNDAEIVELTFLIGLINLLNMFNNCLQVSYNDDYATLPTVQ